MTMFSGGIVANSDQPEAARALLDYLAAPGTAAVKRRYGMDAA
jgi:molybdate transport system substrate-binding protein